MLGSEEELISLKQVAGVLKQMVGRSPCYETIRQWTHIGRKGVVLETVFVGGTKYTTEKAVARFVKDYTQKRSRQPLPGNIDKKASDRARKRIMDMLNYST